MAKESEDKYVEWHLRKFLDMLCWWDEKAGLWRFRGNDGSISKETVEFLVQITIEAGWSQPNVYI